MFEPTPTPSTYAPFAISWLYAAPLLLLALALAVLTMSAVRRPHPGLAAIAGPVGALIQLVALGVMITPVSVEGVTCGSALSSARIRALSDGGLSAVDAACRAQGESVVRRCLIVALLVGAVILGLLLVRISRFDRAGT